MSERRRLAPLNGLRAFEAAARHLSLTLAAEELRVTPAAVSQQVAGLEDYLGLRLFERRNRSLSLTAAGRACLPLISDGFDRIAAGLELLDGLEPRGKLRLWVAPAFAAKWLVPKLDRFADGHPELDVEIVAANGLPDFRREGIDLAVHFGTGELPGLYCERLLAVSALAVCSPALLQGAHPLREPADLRHHRLLHDETFARDGDGLNWSSWLDAVGVTGLSAERGPRFSHAALALEAAVEGQGVALTLDELAAPEIEAGRLVVPFDRPMPLRHGYFLIGPGRALDNAKVAAFVAWIRAEAAREDQPRPAHGER